jgi:hypothetical protein
MDIEVRAGAEFEAVRARIRKAPADIRKQINKGLKQATSPAEEALKHAVQGGTSKGTKGGGSAARKINQVSKSRSKRPGKQGITAAHGLRKNIAKGVTRKISYSGSRSGVRIRADSKYLPASQKSLVKATNRGHWRHPVYGGSNWVGQTFDPANWFDDTMAKEGPAARQRISDVVNQVMRKLQ